MSRVAASTAHLTFSRLHFLIGLVAFAAGCVRRKETWPGSSLCHLPTGAVINTSPAARSGSEGHGSGRL